MIRLSVPGTLRYRALVLRVVASSCKLLRAHPRRLQEASHGSAQEAHENDFDSQVVSAIGEAFNNIAIHGYRDGRSGEVQIEIAPAPAEEGIEVCMMDYGVTFDLSMAIPQQPSSEPDQLPESGMGLFIIRSFMDSVSYRPGSLPEQPNVLRLVKKFSSEVDLGRRRAGAEELPSAKALGDGQKPTRAGK
jgi:serine/threonine-protein kinase RsbW